MIKTRQRKNKSLLKLGQHIRVQIWRNSWLQESMQGRVVEKEYLDYHYNKATELALQIKTLDGSDKFITIDLVN